MLGAYIKAPRALKAAPPSRLCLRRHNSTLSLLNYDKYPPKKTNAGFLTLLIVSLSINVFLIVFVPFEQSVQRNKPCFNDLLTPRLCEENNKKKR